MRIAYTIMTFKRPAVEILEVIGEGNYLQKARRNFYMTTQGWQMLHQLSLRDGVSHSDELELLIRRKYQKKFGKILEVPVRAKAKDAIERDKF